MLGGGDVTRSRLGQIVVVMRFPQIEGDDGMDVKAMDLDLGPGLDLGTLDFGTCRNRERCGGSFLATPRFLFPRLAGL